MVVTTENQKLVKKIEGIHFRPSQFTGAAPEIKQAKIKLKRTFSSNKRGSLNYFTRKQENDRIFQENMIMFQKLKESKASLRKSDFDEHYIEHRKFLNTMSKA